MNDSLQTDDPALPDICDLCRRAIPAGEAAYGRVPDSSWADPVDRELDGWRPIVACGIKHLADMQQYYRQRPFVNEELWAMKIDRAQSAQHPLQLNQEQLTRETGLNLLQIEAAARWGATKTTRDPDIHHKPKTPPAD
ncbi:hypothetical protein J7E88_10430 [Streptomyces sp. ISL-10]|uniref:hypothetical protein n=1 Tax=Streptomyces sp. ISL-10 TaxID=2819172 RepID=UPI001BEB7711|nr:hypothetical protein [Streptomyces sp. ISL-10]MBT2365722.1 hypothetical protein [Streptomyces sp. ISL-10]